MTDTYDHINPNHYKTSSGAEVIQITEDLPFLEGNVVKYAYRAGKKPDQPKLQDLKKALWYLERAIANEEKLLHAQQTDVRLFPLT